MLDEYPDTKIKIVPIFTNSALNETIKNTYINTWQITKIPAFVDTNMTMFKDFNVSGYPFGVVVDKKGAPTETFSGFGAGSPAWFAAAFDKVIGEFKARRQQIIDRWNTIKPSYTGQTYVIEPSVRNPYSIGKVSAGFIGDGLRTLNFARFLVDLPDDVTISEDLTDLAQHGAVVLAATGVLTHTPVKPTDMEQNFFDKGYKSTTSSNISRGDVTIPDFVRSCLKDDHNELNLSTVGHRRWILSPLMKESAFGVAHDGQSSYMTNQVFDQSRIGYALSDYIAWPSGTAFPNSFMENRAPWSIVLNTGKYQEPTIETVTVTLTRASDGKVWTFSKANNSFSADQRYFNVNNVGYGSWNMRYGIIFRPEGVDSYSGEYSVSINGLTGINGNPATLDYSVAFFDMPLDDSTVVPVTFVTLDRYSLHLSVGATATLRATVFPSDATNTEVDWSTSDSSVAVVNSGGQISAVAVGAAVITVKTLDGGYETSCTVTVSESGGADDDWVGDDGNGNNNSSSGGGGCSANSASVMAIAGFCWVALRKRASRKI